MRNRHHLAAVAAGVVAAHAVLLGVLLAGPQRAPASAAAPRPGHAPSARITWLTLPPGTPTQAAALDAAPAARAAVTAMRPHSKRVALQLRPRHVETAALPADVESVPLSELHPLPPAQPALPTPIAGIALPARIGLFGAGGSFAGGRGLAQQTALASVASAAAGRPDPATLAWRAELMAALTQQLPGARDAAPVGTRGRCIVDDDPPRLRCDHPEAEAALGEEARHTIATLLHRLAALDPRPVLPAVAYAEGRFRLEWH